MARYGTAVKYGTGVKYGSGDTPDIPPAPDGLTATATSATQVDVAWSDNATTETGYEVQRRTGAGAYATVQTTAPNVALWTNGGLTASTTYTYRVRALGAGGNSAWSAEATVTTPAASVSPPTAPSGLAVAAISSSQLNLSWADNATTETGYEVERRRSSDPWGPLVTLGANATSHQDTAVVAGTTYTYRVRAVNSAGASAWSNEASGTTSAASVTAPTAPAGLVATAVSGGLVSLSWADLSDNETHFTLQRRIGAGAYADLVAVIAANTTAWPDSTVTYATTYTYRIRAVNSAGASAWSNEASATTPTAPAAAVSADDLQIYAGPLRDQAALPIIEEGADWSPTAGWEEVSSLISSADCAFDGHSHTLTLDLAAWAMDTATFVDDRAIIARARWRDTSGVHVAWRVVFAGHVTGEIAGARLEGTEAGIATAGQVVCSQEWRYFGLTAVPAVTFGWVDLARGRTATASSTLVDLTAEAGLEYLTASSVAPGQAVDGNRDTVWVANTVADPAPPTLLTTGKTVRITEVYNGRGNAGTPGANGRPLWIELWVADVVAAEGFESSVSGWASVRGGAISRSTAWAATGAASMRVVASVAGGAASKDFSGLTPGVEVAVSFTIRSALAAPVVLDVGVAGDGATVWRKLTAPTEATGRRYTMRVPANRHGGINLRFSSTADGQDWYVDDVRISGGLDLVEDGQPYRKLWLVWENGLGASGYADISNGLEGLEAIGGDRAVILVDDLDLYQRYFDGGPDTTAIQFRGLSALASLDVASGRGRLRLAWYRRWPDLPGDGGTVWDDLQFSGLPAFGATQSLVRTQVSPATWSTTNNPAPGGGAATGPAWWSVDVGTYAAPALTAALGTGASVVATLDSTARLPAYGWVYITNERAWMTKLNATAIQLTRSAPVAHSAGEPVAPEVDGVKVTLPLVAALSWRRRLHTPPIQDFDVIGSILTNPADPSVADGGGGVWGEHDDWFPLATVRGWNEPTWTALLGQRPGDWTETLWPPATGWGQGWGRQIRHVRIVVHRMAHQDGRPQRAKINEVSVWEADLSSGGSGEWAGTHPADLRGVIGHLLVQFGGLAANRVRMDRGRGDGGVWGQAYGSLPIAPATLAEALTRLERIGNLRVFCTPGGLVRVVPDPSATSAAFQPAARTWTTANTLSLAATRAPGHPVSQVVVTGRHAVTGDTYRAAYPSTPQPLGRALAITDVILGDQAAAVALAARIYRREWARWRAAAEVGDGWTYLPSPYTRHIVTIADGDRAGVELSGRSMLVMAYRWRYEMTEAGGAWSVEIPLQEVAGWS